MQDYINVYLLSHKKHTNKNTIHNYIESYLDDYYSYGDYNEVEAVKL